MKILLSVSFFAHLLTLAQTELNYSICSVAIIVNTKKEKFTVLTMAYTLFAGNIDFSACSGII